MSNLGFNLYSERGKMTVLNEEHDRAHFVLLCWNKITNEGNIFTGLGFRIQKST